MIKKILQYSISFAIAAGAVVLVMYLTGTFSESDPQKLMSKLSNAFLLIGVIYFGGGGLVFAYNHGVFDIFTYSANIILKIFIPAPHRRPKKKFYEYRMEKHIEPVKVPYLFIIGAIFLIVSVGFLIAFYNV